MLKKLVNNNWISGLLISLVAGFFIWFLTQSNSSPFSGPNVELSELSFPKDLVVDQEFQVSFRATNQRDKPERDCHGFVMQILNEDEQHGALPAVGRANASCKTQTPGFFLGGLSGSSTHILVNCTVITAGTYRMIHGIGCSSGANSRWQLDHETYIQVREK